VAVELAQLTKVFVSDAPCGLAWNRRKRQSRASGQTDRGLEQRRGQHKSRGVSFTKKQWTELFHPKSQLLLRTGSSGYTPLVLTVHVRYCTLGK